MASQVQNEDVIEVYGGQTAARLGGAGTAGDGAGLETNMQELTETLAVGTYRRRFRGPKINGRFSVFTAVDSAAGASSTMAVFYSNLPNPSVASDTDWAPIPAGGPTMPTITSGGNTWMDFNNTDPLWVMVKIVIATSSGNLRVVARVEGTTHGRIG